MVVTLPCGKLKGAGSRCDSDGGRWNFVGSNKTQLLSNDGVEVDATGHDDDVNGEWKYKRRKMGKTKWV